MKVFKSIAKVFLIETLNALPFLFILIGLGGALFLFESMETLNALSFLFGIIVYLALIVVVIISMLTSINIYSSIKNKKVDTAPAPNEDRWTIKEDGTIEKEKSNGFSGLLKGIFILIFTPITYIFNILSKTILCIFSSNHRDKILNYKNTVSYKKALISSSHFMITVLIIFGLFYGIYVIIT